MYTHMYMYTYILPPPLISKAKSVVRERLV